MSAWDQGYNSAFTKLISDYTYLSIISRIDDATVSIFNKKLHYILMASSSSNMKWSPLMEKFRIVVAIL